MDCRLPDRCSEEFPLEEEEPPPPEINPKKLPPTLLELPCVWKLLDPSATSLNAELKVALVEVSASALSCLASDSEKNSDSKTPLVSRRSKTATCCCSPGASGSEYTRSPSAIPFIVHCCASLTM